MLCGLEDTNTGIDNFTQKYYHEKQEFINGSKRKARLTSSLEKLIFFPCCVLLKKSENNGFGFTSIGMVHNWSL